MLRRAIFKTSILLLLLFLLSFFLRFYGLSENLFFGPEQGADFLKIKKITFERDIALIGPKTDIAGVFHGPIYYYIAAIPFLISHGDPVTVSIFLIFINSLTVFLIYILGRDLFNKRVGFLAAGLFSVSFGAIVFPRWLSGQPLSIPLSCLFFILLHKFLQGKKWSIFPLGLTYALLGQAEFLHFILFGGILVVSLFCYRKDVLRYKKSYLVIGGLALVFLSTANYILFDLLHNFIISKSLFQLIHGQKGYYISLFKSLEQVLSSFFDVLIHHIAPFQKVVTTFVIVSSVVALFTVDHKKAKYKLLLPIWIFVPLLLIILLRHGAMEQFFVGMVAGIILWVAVGTAYVMKKNALLGILFLILLLGLNVYSWENAIPKNEHMFFQATQPRLRLKDQKAVIDQIYFISKDSPFEFQAYTIPYWWQDGWKYLFWYYGEKKYGTHLKEEKAPLLFVIIQDDPSNKPFQNDWRKNTVSKWGIKQSEFQIGVLTVEVLKKEQR